MDTLPGMRSPNCMPMTGGSPLKIVLILARVLNGSLSGCRVPVSGLTVVNKHLQNIRKTFQSATDGLLLSINIVSSCELPTCCMV